MTEFFGIRSMRPMMKVSIPPARGPKSFVIQSMGDVLIRIGAQQPMACDRVKHLQL